MAGLVAGFALLVAALPAYAGALVGQHMELRLSDLPEPYSQVARPALPGADEFEPAVRAAGVMPRVPAGFHVDIFASGLNRPREMAVAADGTVFVSQTHDGSVVALRDDDRDGVADRRVVFADRFREPSGLAVQDGALYIADRRAVWRIGFDGDPLKPQPRMMVTRPGALGQGGGHITREIVFAPDGKHFYVSIGSETNAGEDRSPRATIQEFRPDGHMQTTYASGLRNPVGMAFYPGTDDLYAVVTERDGLGAGLVPDYFTRVARNGFYGFPYAYLGPHPDPQFGEFRPDLVASTLEPDTLFPPHSTPLGLLFYEGKALPPDFRGDAIIALHGTPGGTAGYQLVRVHFREGRPQGGYETFMAGFDARDQLGSETMGASGAGVWGRPVWIVEAADGALLVSDDVANVIWRVSWLGISAGEEARHPLGSRAANGGGRAAAPRPLAFH
jgi:glucose/arabinose dehydrogenase